MGDSACNADGGDDSALLGLRSSVKRHMGTSGDVWCNPNPAMGQLCPGQIQCPDCGSDSCLCPPKPEPTAAPTPAPTAAPTAAPIDGLECFCPSKTDLQWDYIGNSELNAVVDGGWTIAQGTGETSGGRVSTKGSFDLLGGYVEFDMDISKTIIGTNTNVYGIFPLPMPAADGSNSFFVSNYCDGQVSDTYYWCPEMDILENNGPVAWASTYHTQAHVTGSVHDANSWGCDPSGCAADRLYTPPSCYESSCDGGNRTVIDSAQPYKVRAEFSQDLGAMTVTLSQGSESVVIAGADFQNTAGYPPMGPDFAVMKEYMQSRGMVLESSQWVGWVPMNETCPSFNPTGDGSTFSVSNLKFKGRLVAGTASKCKCGKEAPVAKVANWRKLKMGLPPPTRAAYPIR